MLSPDDYIEGEVLEIHYSVTTPQGDKPYREIFFIKSYIKRTCDFIDYLVTNDIPLDDLTAFVGCREELTFKKTIHNNKSMITIAKRRFLGKGEANIA